MAAPRGALAGMLLIALLVLFMIRQLPFPSQRLALPPAATLTSLAAHTCSTSPPGRRGTPVAAERAKLCSPACTLRGAPRTVVTERRIKRHVAVWALPDKQENDDEMLDVLDDIIRGDRRTVDTGKAFEPERESILQARREGRTYVPKDYNWTSAGEALTDLKIEASMRLLRLAVEDLVSESRALVQANLRLTQVFEKQIEMNQRGQIAALQARQKDVAMQIEGVVTAATNAHENVDHGTKKSSIFDRKEGLHPNPVSIQSDNNDEEQPGDAYAMMTSPGDEQPDNTKEWLYELLFDDLQSAGHGISLERIVKDNIDDVDIDFLKWLSQRTEDTEDQTKKVQLERLLGRVSFYRERILNNGVDAQEWSKTLTPAPAAEDGEITRSSSMVGGEEKKANEKKEGQVVESSIQRDDHSIDVSNGPTKLAAFDISKFSNPLDEILSQDANIGKRNSENMNMVSEAGINSLGGMEDEALRAMGFSDMVSTSLEERIEELKAKAEEEKVAFREMSENAAKLKVSPRDKLRFESEPEKPLIKEVIDLSGYDETAQQRVDWVIQQLSQAGTATDRRRILEGYVAPSGRYIGIEKYADNEKRPNSNTSDEETGGTMISVVFLMHRIQQLISAEISTHNMKSEEYLNVLIGKTNDRALTSIETLSNKEIQNLPDAKQLNFLHLLEAEVHKYEKDGVGDNDLGDEWVFLADYIETKSHICT
eukprot:jgi/Bigna1/131440/aug1.14_g6148